VAPELSGGRLARWQVVGWAAAKHGPFWPCPAYAAWMMSICSSGPCTMLYAGDCSCMPKSREIASISASMSISRGITAAAPRLAPLAAAVAASVAAVVAAAAAMASEAASEAACAAAAPAATAAPGWTPSLARRCIAATAASPAP
jgi:hypothetical protein